LFTSYPVSGVRLVGEQREKWRKKMGEGCGMEKVFWVRPFGLAVAILPTLYTITGAGEKKNKQINYLK